MAFPSSPPRSTKPQPKPKLPEHLSAAATGAADDDAAYWAEQARGSLPAPFGDLVAQAIESCARTKTSTKLIPGAPAGAGSRKWASPPSGPRRRRPIRRP